MSTEVLRYTKQLDSDILKLTNRPPKRKFRHYADIHDRLMDVSQGSSTKNTMLDMATTLTTSDMETYLGQQTLKIIQNKGFQTKLPDEIRLCKKAEYYIPYYLNPSTTRTDYSLPQPVILTNNGELVGILKHYEEMNVYGLQDDPENNIYAGALHYPTAPFDLTGERFFARRPWKLSAKIFSIAPTRMTAFAIPIEVRRELKDATMAMEPKQVPTLLGTHEEIVKLAHDALDDARFYENY